jgi:hypothetical protein
MPKDSEYDPVCVTGVSIRCAKAEVVKSMLDIDARVAQEMMARLQEDGQMIQVISKETGTPLSPIAVHSAVSPSKWERMAP